MKQRLSVYYANVENMGDLLNKYIIKECFGYETVRHTFLTGKLSGIGSGLGNFTLSDQWHIAMLERMAAVFFPEVYIWGTGFIEYKQTDSPFYKRNVKICAVRGELSKRRVERLVGRKLDIPLGDAGLLASYLLKERPAPKYDVGIIAHYKEQDCPEFSELLNRFDNSIGINVRDNPLTVVKQIAECRTIISSSLHGLIIADSFHIPNRHIVVSDRLLGDGFKFDDYYSAYGLPHKYTDLNRERIESLDAVAAQYQVPSTAVEEIKREMIACFPYPNLS